jgi:hypothetical protein
LGSGCLDLRLAWAWVGDCVGPNHALDLERQLLPVVQLDCVPPFAFVERQHVSPHAVILGLADELLHKNASAGRNRLRISDNDGVRCTEARLAACSRGRRLLRELIGRL